MSLPTQNPNRIYKILAVDDKPENLYTLEQLLKRLEGVKVYSASSGNDALALTLENEFCVAIVDVQMPEMDGYEFVELLRGNRPTAQLPVIFVSAIFSDEYHHRRGYDVGAVDFLSKPFIPEILLSKVTVFINLYEQRALLEEWSQLMERMVYQRTEELSQALHRLEKLDRAKTDFIEVAAHELRTPLTLIFGYAGVLAEMLKGDAAAFGMVQGIITGHDRLLEVINNMLDVSRIDNASLKLHKQLLSVKNILDKILKNLGPSLLERQVVLEIQGIADLPQIYADPDLLQKLFYHLVVNAIKYTPDGRSVIIRGQQAQSGNAPAIEVNVVDSGIGIDAQYHELIFEKFYQTGQVRLHSSGRTKYKGGGPGLGLAIARGVVVAHGGKIWVESPGHDEETFPGSTFHILLPIGSAA